MATTLSLSLGEFFAEASIKQNEEIQNYRWPLSKTSLEKGLLAFFETIDTKSIDQVQVNLPILESLLKRRLGTPPAFLTTEGFENWLEMNLPVEPNHFCLHPRRTRSPLDSDLIFGVSERIRSNGEVLRSPEPSEIEFLASKLQMNEVKWVALGLLHSKASPQHERQIAEILRGKDFQVIESHNFDHSAERARWWAAVLSAYLTPMIEEWTQEVYRVLQKAELNVGVQYWTVDGLVTSWKPEKALSFLFGSAAILNQWGQRHSSPGLLHLDLEGFYYHDSSGLKTEWMSELGPVATPALCWRKLAVQPTSPVQESWLGGVEIGKVELGFEPGPIALGRGLIPSLLDCIWLAQDLSDIVGLRGHFQEKSRGRIEEALSTLVRNFSRDEWSDPRELSLLLSAMAVREILRFSLQADEEKVHLSGSLAHIFQQQALKASALKPLQAHPCLLTDMALEASL